MLTLPRCLSLFCLTLACHVFLASSSSAQQRDDARALQHDDYDRWNTINASALSPDGKWVMYAVRDGKENVTLKFRKAGSNQEYSIANGTGARFTDDSQIAIFRVTPDKELLEKLKKEKKKPEEMPRSKLTMLRLDSGRATTVENVSSFKTPRDSSTWVAFLLGQGKAEAKMKTGSSTVNETFEITPNGLQQPARKTKASPKKSTAPAKSESARAGKTSREAGSAKRTAAASQGKADPKTTNEKNNKKEKKAGSELVLYNLETGVEQRFPHVVSFEFSKSGNLLVFSTSTKDQPGEDGVWVMDLNRGSVSPVLTGLGEYRGLAINDSGNGVAFLTNRDDYESKSPKWSLYHWRTGQKKALPTVTPESSGMAEGWSLAAGSQPVFSEDGRRLFFNTAPLPPAEKEESGEPQAKLDLWHWQDPQLQPQQLIRAEQDRNRSYRAVYDLKSKKMTQLATREIPQVTIDPRSSSDVAVGTSQEKYKKLMSWDLPGFQDTYLIDLKSGSARPVLEKGRSGGRLSPGGKYILWWDTDQRAWMALPTANQKGGGRPVSISTGIPHELYDVLHDTPSDPRPYGVAGWLDDDRGLLVYDRYDIWLLDPSGRQAAKCVTQGAGRADSRRYRYVQLDPLQRSINPEQRWVLSMFDEGTKASGYATLDLGSGKAPATRLSLDENVGGLKKAKDSDAVLMTRSTFRRSPDLWYSTLAMDTLTRISRINPQQMEYRWGTAELVHWDSADGTPLDGILYKPDGFDPQKKYPMLVYFYERNSDKLHSYYPPAAGRSIINFSFYVSRGYLVFVPDIPYKTGFPGQSAADAILPGVNHLVKQGFIDEAKIGMQGHSWGGYQTAFLVTQTDMFACAESGAPVSNMTSAYGGIRWSSGMSRMFQYEKTQSRIGATLWEDREKYILNSPLFHADKINTPLLILHNDEDGAVPWYQGIELFVALRRLEKPAWLLNYNQQPHWVMKRENRLDFARRMQQFFDHYLMDAPMPVWMASGIPAVDKGKKFGFEPAEPAATAGQIPGKPAGQKKKQEP